MKARIYKPAKTAMQSGVKKRDFWLLEFEPEQRKYVEPLMGWTGSGDTKQQLKMKFTSQELAVEYAKRNNIPYTLSEPKKRKPIKKSYADNFAYIPPAN
jgi:hypothetical protein